VDDKMRAWRWRILASTWLCYAGFYFCRKPFYIAKASMGEEFGWSAPMLGQAGAVYLICYTLGQFMAGLLGDRLGPRIVLLSGLAATVGCNVAFGLTNGYGSLLGFMALNGFAQATGWSCTVGTMGAWFHRRERGTIMGVWATNYTVGGVLGTSLAAFVLGAYGFRYSFFAGSIVVALVWVFFFFNQRNKPEDVGLPPVADDEEEEEEEPGTEVGAAAGARAPAAFWTRAVVTTVLIVGCFYFFVKFIRYTLWSWAPYFLQREFGLDGDEAGYVSVIFDLCGVAGVIFAGWASDRFFNSRRAKISFLLLIAMFFSCLLMYTLGATATWIFAATMGLVGFTLYGPDSLMTGAGAIDIGSARHATLAAGIINGMGAVGSVVQDLVVGDIYEASGGSLTPIFGMLLGCSVAAAALMGVVLWRNRRAVSDV